MFLPKLHTLIVLLYINVNTTSSVLLSQAVSHGRDWCHRKLVIDVLGLDGDDAVLVVNIFIWILVAHARILLLDLLFTIENYVQVLGLANSPLWHLGVIKPSAKYGELLLIPCLVSALQILFIFRRDLDKC